MSTPKLQEDCVGITLQVTFTERDGVTPVPLTGSPAVFMRFKNPVTGETVERTASVVGDGTTGTIAYVTTAEDLHEPGTWQFQGTANWGSGTTVLHTLRQKIKVKPNL